MRKLIAGLAAALAVTLLLPTEAPARRILVLGSLEVTQANGDPIASGEVTGLAVILNPGLEKAMAQQLPPYMIPVFVDAGPGGANLDTFLALTNTLGTARSVRVTLYGSDGGALGNQTLLLPARGTVSLFVSTLVP